MLRSDFTGNGGDSGSGGGGGAGADGSAKPKPANKLEQKQLNALKGCVSSRYNINLRTFVPVAPGSNGYFFGLNGNAGGITVETNVTHSSWTLGLMSFRPWPVAGLTYGSRSPNQLNYMASNQGGFDSPGLIQPTQIHELAHALDNITSGQSSEASADKLLQCINESQ